jgi:hypothetical protein
MQQQIELQQRQIDWLLSAYRRATEKPGSISTDLATFPRY